jgi:glucosylceramidase
MKIYKNFSFMLMGIVLSISASAQSFTWVSSTEGHCWQRQSLKAQKLKNQQADLVVDPQKSVVTFKAWGTCFNELGWDALNLLSADLRKKVLDDLFSPQGDLKFTMGRIPMNANDYARSWYSCDEVDGDFELKYFNINQDKETLIPFIKSAQKRNPAMKFWVSPWSPPSWMKINHNYAVKSSAEMNKMSPQSDVALFQSDKTADDAFFPKQLAVNDYFIQDPRYLTAYANYFCRFIDAYKEQNIPIKTVMYQNEAYSYTIYPGCAWTPEGSIRFNSEYLAPALKLKHPEVSLGLGTINTNRFELIDKMLSDPRMTNSISSVGFQWEGGQILPKIRAKYPQYSYVQTESECGWGEFNWKSAEHTFNLINSYLGNGCEEYTFWNAILPDDGVSGWGWKQNALLRVNSTTKEFSYTPEYYAVKHYCKYVVPGSKVLAVKQADETGKSVIVFLTPDNKYVVLAGNVKNTPQIINVQLGNHLLRAQLKPHSLNSFVSN